MALKISKDLEIEEKYDLIVVGGGAAGLFFAASLDIKGHKGMIVEASKSLGQKLLATGGGRCNFTHNGSIKDFPLHYHSLSMDASTFVRSPLYKFNNKLTVNFFESLGVDSYIQDDGRVFPSSNSSITIRNTLLEKCRENSWTFSMNTSIVNIEKFYQGFILESSNGSVFLTKNLVIASGGPAYRNSCSINMLDSLSKMGIDIVRPIPSLTPIRISSFDIGKLSGISFENAELKLISKNNGKVLYKRSGSLLITELGFSGPLVLNASAFINSLIDKNSYFLLEICPDKSLLINKFDFSGVNMNLSNSIRAFTNLPDRYIKYYCGELSQSKASSVPRKYIASIINRMLRLKYSSSLILKPSFNNAMSSLGGVSLEEINNKTFQSKSLEGLYVIGEALDISGDTGGYNLQFMWSSAHAVTSHIKLSL